LGAREGDWSLTSKGFRTGKARRISSSLISTLHNNQDMLFVESVSTRVKVSGEQAKPEWWSVKPNAVLRPKAKILLAITG
jgi:hypothetical protein